MAEPTDGELESLYYNAPFHGIDWERADTYDTREAVKWMRELFDAGVAEGIRRAREEVQLIPCRIAPDGTTDFDLPDHHARVVVLDAIDAAEEADRG